MRLLHVLRSYILNHRTFCLSKRHRSSNNYAGTLNLPRTLFPLSMKGNVAPEREVEIQKKCSFDDLYQWQWNDTDRDQLFVLHDGPPYANGDPHVGHALNKILKDITNRYKLMQGYRVHYVPGWDCHGTPIEQKVLTEIRSDHRRMDPIDIRAKATVFARKAANKQLAAFRRWGVMADWKTGCYYTFDKAYEVAQLEAFFRMYEKDLVYQDYMPVQWSPSSGTALAEAEIEYNDCFQSTAVYVKYKLHKLSDGLSVLLPSNADVYLLIWTTTPWTLPLNQAICFGSNIDYCLVKGQSSSVFIVAAAFYEKMCQLVDEKLNILSHFQGSALVGCSYVNPAWGGRDSPVLPASHVTVAKGTGLVHTAPAHGAEDFQVALKYNLPMDCYVDEDGRYLHGVEDCLVGKSVLHEGGKLVLDVMADQIVSRETITHSYPHDWRTKQPLITRASRQWFVNTARLKDKTLECLNAVRVYPSASNVGMRAQLERRTYWCISRQRVWGLPIPAFYESQSRKPLISRASIDHLKSLVAVKGSDCWWNLTTKELLPDDVIVASGHNPALQYERGRDVLDIWFDSGISWSHVLTDCDHVADVYLEGVDQFGGWFQSSLLTSVGVQQKAPYRSLVVHGFVLDEEGKKMSKSIGNVVDPDVVINGGKDKKANPAYGVDVLRLWVAQSGTDPRVHIGPNNLNACKERLFKIRKSLRYLMSNLDDFNPVQDMMSYDKLRIVDQYTLHLLYDFVKQTTEAYEEFNYSRAVNIIDKFCGTCVSAFHSHITKDRMYCNHKTSVDRRSAQTVQYFLLSAVTRLIAPILPHLSEEVHQHHPLRASGGSVFKMRWFVADEAWLKDEISAIVNCALEIRETFNGLIASDRPGDYDVTIVCPLNMYEQLKVLQADGATSSHSDLCELLQSACATLVQATSSVAPSSSSSDNCTETSGVCRLQLEDGSSIERPYSLQIRASQRCQCPRCRRLVSDVADSLCDRCHTVVAIGT